MEKYRFKKIRLRNSVIETINGTKQLIVWNGETVNGVNPDNGKLYWSVDFKPEYGMAIGAPRVWNDLVFVMGFNGKSGAIKISKDSRSASLLWGLDRRLGVAGTFIPLTSMMDTFIQEDKRSFSMH